MWMGELPVQCKTSDRRRRRGGTERRETMVGRCRDSELSFGLWWVWGKPLSDPSVDHTLSPAMTMMFCLSPPFPPATRCQSQSWDIWSDSVLAGLGVITVIFVSDTRGKGKTREPFSNVLSFDPCGISVGEATHGLLLLSTLKCNNDKYSGNHDYPFYLISHYHDISPLVLSPLPRYVVPGRGADLVKASPETQNSTETRYRPSHSLIFIT